MPGESSSDSRYACIWIGVFARVGDVSGVGFDTFDIVRRMGELDAEGEFGSDSGNLGS